MEEVFSCTYCEQQLKTLKGYVAHCRFHRNECNNTFPCPYRTCFRRCSSYKGFFSHVQRDHGKQAKRDNTGYNNIAAPLQCQIAFCKQICDDIQDFLKHLREHIDVGTAVSCPFKWCFIFQEIVIFIAHIVWIQDENQDNGLEHQIIDAADEDIFDDEQIDETDNVKELYLKNLLLFYLKLESKCLLPASTIQNIVEAFKDIHRLGQSLILKKLQSCFKDLDIPDDKAK